MKTCKKCKLDKTMDSFYKHKGKCKDCYQQDNKQWRINNKELVKETSRKLYLKHKVNRRKPRREYASFRRKNDPIFALRSSLSSKISKNIHKDGKKSVDILGCSFSEFKNYLESKFESWMTWENRGLYNGELNYGWDIDHIIPISSGISEEEIIKLNHYTNLQPLCSKVNRDIKKDKILFDGDIIIK